MGRKRQHHQLELSFMAESRGETPTAVREGTEPPAAKHDTESPASTGPLMEEVCQREKLTEALKRVRQNKGSPGVDGMTVHKLPGYLKDHWPTIRAQLLAGTYVPQPVKRVEIPKPGGVTGKAREGLPMSIAPSILNTDKCVQPNACERRDYSRISSSSMSKTSVDPGGILGGRPSCP